MEQSEGKGERTDSMKDFECPCKYVRPLVGGQVKVLWSHHSDACVCVCVCFDDSSPVPPAGVCGAVQTN